MRRLMAFRFGKVSVWGTGALRPQHLPSPRDVEVFAVRGPLTRDAMGLPPDTPIGDPGLLISEMGIKSDKKFRWGIIPHVADRSSSSVQSLIHKNKDALFIDLADPDILGSAQKILSCEFIVSSSLHGTIAADAFNIPNVWMERTAEEVIGGDWKYMDYFQSVGRTDSRPLNPVSDILDLRRLEDAAMCAKRDLVDDRRKDLFSSFERLKKNLA